jgi:dynein heavy chain
MRQKLKEDVKIVLKSTLERQKLNVLSPEPLRAIRFGEVLGEASDRDKPYQELTDAGERVCLRLEQVLEDYNAGSRRPMALVLFDFAVDHVLRIARLLKLQGAHALLVGLGGSGRQSLTYLAAHLREQPVHTIEATKAYGRE